MPPSILVYALKVTLSDRLRKEKNILLLAEEMRLAEFSKSSKGITKVFPNSATLEEIFGSSIKLVQYICIQHLAHPETVVSLEHMLIYIQQWLPTSKNLREPMEAIITLNTNARELQRYIAQQLGMADISSIILSKAPWVGLHGGSPAQVESIQWALDTPEDAKLCDPPYGLQAGHILLFCDRNEQGVVEARPPKRTESALKIQQSNC